MISADTLRCRNCGTELAFALLVCPGCQRLVHADRLKALSAEAEAAEASGDLATAASRWQDALALLPHDTRQAAVVQERTRALGERMAASPGKPAEPRPAWAKRGGVLGFLGLLVWKLKFVIVLLLTKAKLLLLGLTKLSTLGTMLLAFGVYWGVWGWRFAAGLVGSIYIHEMGHVAALTRYGIKATPPMFLPGFGAVVRLRQYPPTPGLDARVGLAGPLWGLGAAIAAYGLFAITGSPLWAAVAKVGAWINLFNLLPVWTLDGGRGFRALTRADRWLAVGVLAATWAATRESLLVLLMLAAGVQAFSQAPEERDLPVLGLYGLLVVTLAGLTLLPVAMP